MFNTSYIRAELLCQKVSVMEWNGWKCHKWWWWRSIHGHTRTHAHTHTHTHTLGAASEEDLTYMEFSPELWWFCYSTSPLPLLPLFFLCMPFSPSAHLILLPSLLSKNRGDREPLLTSPLLYNRTGPTPTFCFFCTPGISRLSPVSTPPSPPFPSAPLFSLTTLLPLRARRDVVKVFGEFLLTKTNAAWLLALLYMEQLYPNKAGLFN